MWSGYVESLRIIHDFKCIADLYYGSILQIKMPPFLRGHWIAFPSLILGLGRLKIRMILVERKR